MKTWKLAPDFWSAIENGVNHYIKYPLRCDKEDMSAEPRTPFGATFHHATFYR
jgi:hypothetical protein